MLTKARSLLALFVTLVNQYISPLWSCDLKSSYDIKSCDFIA